MRRPARFITFFDSTDKNVSAETIRHAITTRYKNWAKQVEPVLKPGGNPMFNTILPLADGSYLVDLVSLEKERLVRDGYGFKKDTPIHHDWVLVYGSPAKVEIASRTAEQLTNVLRTFASAGGLKPETFAPRAFETPSQWKALQAHFNAEVGGHKGNGRDRKEPADYSMHAKTGERLDDLPLWNVLKLAHDRARELRFHFTLPFHIDGYPELVVYYINTLTGQIKFPDDTSEYARSQVRNEYVAIAKRP
jgi:hypothetical protein